MSRIILCLKVRKSRSFYVHIYIFLFHKNFCCYCCLVLLFFAFGPIEFDPLLRPEQILPVGVQSGPRSNKIKGYSKLFRSHELEPHY